MFSFIANFPRSFFSSDLYREALSHSNWKRFWYLYFLAVFVFFLSIFSVAGTAVFKGDVNLVEKIKQIPDKLIAEVDQSYPNNLVITINQGRLSINQADPVILNPKSFVPDENTKSFILIDPKASVDKFTEYKTNILVTERVIAAMDSRNSQIKMITFDSPEFKGKAGETLTISRVDYDKLINFFRVNSHYFPKIVLGFMAIAALFGLTIFPLFGVVFFLIALLFYSLLGLMLSKGFRKNLDYSKVYILSVYLISPGAAMMALGIGNILVRLLLYSLLFVLLAPKQGDTEQAQPVIEV